jgi:hypothetical protein
MVRGGERHFFRADQRMEKWRCRYEGSQGGERRGVGVSSRRMECAPHWYEGSQGWREIGTCGGAAHPSHHASPSFASRSRWNERGKRRRDGREKHDSGDELLFPCGSMGNGLRRHESFLVEGVSKRQRGLVGVPLKALCLVLVISDNAQVLIMCLRLYVAKDD